MAAHVCLLAFTLTPARYLSQAGVLFLFTPNDLSGGKGLKAWQPAKRVTERHIFMALDCSGLQSVTDRT